MCVYVCVCVCVCVNNDEVYMRKQSKYNSEILDMSKKSSEKIELHKSSRKYIAYVKQFE